MSSRRIYLGMEGFFLLRFSPVHFSFQSVAQNHRRRSYRSCNCTLVAFSAMVSHFSPPSNIESCHFATFPLFTIFSFQESTSGVEKPFPGGREVIREAFQLQQVPATALDVILASLAPSTIQQYARPLQNWWTFCQTWGISLYSPEVNQVLEFLNQEIQHINTYSTLNTIRSAISLVSSTEIGNHPLIKRFYKGASVLKPQRPRYDFVWDPAPVIEKLATIFPYNTSIPLAEITRKLVLLLALGSGQRAQILAAIRTSYISFSSDKLII